MDEDVIREIGKVEVGEDGIPFIRLYFSKDTIQETAYRRGVVAERETALPLIRDMREWMESMCVDSEWTKKKYIAYECLNCHSDRCNNLNCKRYDKIIKRIEDYDDRIKRAKEYEEDKIREGQCDSSKDGE